MKRLTNTMMALLASASLMAQQLPMSELVEGLMSKMTLKEKIGQLNLLPGGDITTGAIVNSPLAQLAQAGELGAVLNVKGPEKIRTLQRIAV